MADEVAALRDEADKKADAAKAERLTPDKSLRLQLEALRLEIRAAARAAEIDRLHASL